MFWSIFASSFLGVLSGLGLHILVRLYDSNKDKKDKYKENIATFRKELKFNINRIENSIAAIDNFIQAITSSSIRLDFNYNATIQLCVTVFHRFINDGIIFEILDSKDIAELDKNYNYILYTFNTQTVEAINHVINEAIQGGTQSIKDDSEFSLQNAAITVKTLLEENKIFLEKMLGKFNSDKSTHSKH